VCNKLDSIPRGIQTNADSIPSPYWQRALLSECTLVNPVRNFRQFVYPHLLVDVCLVTVRSLFLVPHMFSTFANITIYCFMFVCLFVCEWKRAPDCSFKCTYCRPAKSALTCPTRCSYSCSTRCTYRCPNKCIYCCPPKCTQCWNHQCTCCCVNKCPHFCPNKCYIMSCPLCIMLCEEMYLSSSKQMFILLCQRMCILMCYLLYILFERTCVSICDLSLAIDVVSLPILSVYVFELLRVSLFHVWHPLFGREFLQTHCSSSPVSLLSPASLFGQAVFLVKFSLTLINV